MWDITIFENLLMKHHQACLCKNGQEFCWLLYKECIQQNIHCIFWSFFVNIKKQETEIEEDANDSQPDDQEDGCRDINIFNYWTIGEIDSLKCDWILITCCQCILHVDAYKKITQLDDIQEMMSNKMLIEHVWQHLFMTLKDKAVPENANNQINTCLEMLQIDTY